MNPNQNKTVDVYLPLDGRDRPNQVVWPVATSQLKELIQVIEGTGWRANVLNPDRPISSVAEGIRVAKTAKAPRFLNFMAGWAYPDFSVSPMGMLPAQTPKLMLGSLLSDFPGAVGLFAAASGTAHVGIETSRLFVEKFEDRNAYANALKEFLENGKIEEAKPQTVSIDVTENDRKLARQVKETLKGQIYGCIGPRSMQMWNKISEADFLRYFGIAKESFDGLRIAKMAEKIQDSRAEAAIRFLQEKGMEIRMNDQAGADPGTELTKEMVVHQMKVYFALLELKKQYGLDFAGVQDQLDWIEHYPATDLTLGLLNNKLRPETDGTTFVTSTEADDGAAMAMQVLKLLQGGEPSGFNDLRYWDPKQNLYWFVNSGSLAPYFAHGSHETLRGSWSERQTAMYFGNGGGTCTVVVKKPGVATWARFSYRNHRMYLCAGRGITDVPTEQQWLDRSARCSRDWPQWYLKLCGKVERHLNTNHPMTAFGDWLAPLKALAAELDMPFECYDTVTPEELQAGKNPQ